MTANTEGINPKGVGKDTSKESIVGAKNRFIMEIKNPIMSNHKRAVTINIFSFDSRQYESLFTE
jgi:hypothetical protein